MLSRTKACALPYKWPLLADGQDPDALEARLAYHLHRLKLTGQPLREVLKRKAYLATALSQARLSVEHDFISHLASSLNISADELTRVPTENEAHEWRFYRLSAANREAVWNNAMALARSNNMSLRATAETIGMDVADLVNAKTGKRIKVLEWHQAQRLVTKASPPQNPYSLLPEAPVREVLGQISTPEL
jgi:hypothetical protein